MPSYRIKRKRTERLNFKPQLQVETMKRLESIFHGVQKTKTSTLDTKAAVKKIEEKKKPLSLFGIGFKSYTTEKLICFRR